jgi:proteic killer suppression protein
MNLIFTNKTKYLENEKETRRKHGHENAIKIANCFALIRSSDNLQEFLEERMFGCHLLRGKYENCYGLHIIHPHRIVIKPTNDPIPLKSNNEIDTSQITEVELIYIGDYHE